MSLAYTSGDFTVASAIGKVRGSSPFPGDKNEYVWQQDFMQFRANFVELALNTAHPDNSDFILVSESERQDMGGGVVRWTRTYAKLPSSRNDYTTMNYRFIGYAGFFGFPDPLTSAHYLSGRQPFTRSVTARLANDYYFVDGTLLVSPRNIPIIEEQKYFIIQGSLDTSVPPVFTPKYSDPVQSAKFGLAQDYIYDVSGDFFWSYVPCSPSRSDYEALRVAGTEIVAEASQVTRWMGNIYQRVTKYVVAQ